MLQPLATQVPSFLLLVVTFFLLATEFFLLSVERNLSRFFFKYAYRVTSRFSATHFVYKLNKSVACICTVYC
jgi:hypothetical protein